MCFINGILMWTLGSIEVWYLGWESRLFGVGGVSELFWSVGGVSEANMRVGFKHLEIILTAACARQE